MGWHNRSPTNQRMLAEKLIMTPSIGTRHIQLFNSRNKLPKAKGPASSRGNKIKPKRVKQITQKSYQDKLGRNGKSREPYLQGPVSKTDEIFTMDASLQIKMNERGMVVKDPRAITKNQKVVIATLAMAGWPKPGPTKMVVDFCFRQFEINSQLFITKKYIKFRQELCI
jgi:hypothetical protein